MLWKVLKALALASAICDRVPNRWHHTHEIGSAEADIGDMVNAHPDGTHGYRLIQEAEAELVAYLTTPQAAPPRREWQGLTEEEAAACWSDSAVDTWRAIEAALREKNALAQPEPPCPYVRHGRDGTHWCALAEQSAQPATITSPRGSLGEPIV